MAEEKSIVDRQESQVLSWPLCPVGSLRTAYSGPPTGRGQLAIADWRLALGSQDYFHLYLLL